MSHLDYTSKSRKGKHLNYEEAAQYIGSPLDKQFFGDKICIAKSKCLCYNTTIQHL